MSSTGGCGPCCLNPGHKAAHTVKGAEVEYAGVKAYRVGSNKEKAVILVTDVFGLLLENIKKVADRISESGFTVIIPNIFHDALDPTKPLDFSVFPEWLKRNPVATAIEIVEKTVNQLQAEGFKSIGASGYCYGAKPVVTLLQNKKINVGAVSHPSFLAQGDGAKLHAGQHLLVNAAEVDSTYVPDLRADFESGAKTANVKLSVIDYPGTSHGFASRPMDSDVAKAEKALELASLNTAKFFASAL